MTDTEFENKLAALPVAVFIFSNGNVAATNINGDQIEALQGSWEKKKAAIFAAARKGTQFNMRDNAARKEIAAAGFDYVTTH